MARPIRPSAATAAACAFILGLIPTAASAQQTQFTNAAGDGRWFNPANWSAGVPTETSVATAFPLTTDLRLEGGSAVARQLFVNATQTVNITAGRLTLEQISVGGGLTNVFVAADL